MDNIDLADQDLIFTTSTITDEPARTFKLANGEVLQVPVLPTIESCVIKSGALALEGVATQNTASLTLVDEPSIIEYNDVYFRERENKGGSVWGRMLSRDRTLNKSKAILSFRETPQDRYTDTAWVIGSIGYPSNGRVTVQLIDPLTFQLKRPSLVQKGQAVGRKVTKTVDPRVNRNLTSGAFYRLDKEILQLKTDRTWRRGARGTDIADHQSTSALHLIEDIVQPAAAWTTAFQRVTQKFFPAFYDSADSAEQRRDIARMRVVLSLYRPEPILDIYANLAMAAQVAIYYDIFAGKLRFRVNYLAANGSPQYDITENQTLILKPPSATLVSVLQRTQVVYTSNLADPLDDKSYQVRSVDSAESLDGELLRIGDSIENQYSRSGVANAARRVQRYGISPLDVNFMVNAADFLTLWIGDTLTFTYGELAQGNDGAGATTTCVATQVIFDVIKGHKTIKGLSVNRLLTFSQGSSIVGPDGLIVYEQKKTLNGLVENINLFDLSGGINTRQIFNVKIEDDTIIGGTVIDNKTVPALIIDLFAQGSIINITVGRRVRIVGAAGSGGSQSNSASSLNRTPTAGGAGLIIGGVNSPSTVSGQPRFTVNWILKEDLHIAGGGGGGGAGSTYENADEDIDYDDDAKFTPGSGVTKAQRDAQEEIFGVTVNKGGDGSGYSGGLQVAQHGSIKCSRMPYLLRKGKPTRSQLGGFDLQRWVMPSSVGRIVDRGNFAPNAGDGLKAGRRGSDAFVYTQTSRGTQSKSSKCLELFGNCNTRRWAFASWDFVVTTGQGGGGGGMAAGGGAGGRRKYSGIARSRGEASSSYRTYNDIPFGLMRNYVPTASTSGTSSVGSAVGLGEVTARGSFRADFAANEQNGAAGGRWYQKGDAASVTVKGGRFVANKVPELV